MIIELCAGIFSAIYGCCTIFHKKTSLFYKIVFFAMLTGLMGNIYTVLFTLLWQPDHMEFHVGYLGYIGMFFFLYSSYYGAINSLADGKQPELKPFRSIAGITVAIFLVGSTLLMHLFERAFWMYLLIIPMSLTLYFAMKHLIIPDVDMGIIKVMRPYNALIIALCICMLLRILTDSGTVLSAVSSIGIGILLALCLPSARNGVQKWFI